MPSFHYKSRGSAQEFKEGVIEAASQQDAVVKILGMGQTPISVELAKDPARLKNSTAPKTPGASVSSGSLSFFFRSLSDLIESGLPLLGSLEALAKQRLDVPLKAAITRMAMDVREGASLSRAMEGCSGVFGVLPVSMVRSAEMTGNVVKTLRMLGQHLEKDAAIRHRLKSALTYPAMILSVGVGSVIVLLTFVFPRLTVMFEDLGAQLPLPTKMVMAFSQFLLSWWWLLCLAAVMAAVAVAQYGATPNGRLAISRAMLKTFWLGDLVRAAHISRYARTLALQLDNGVPVTAALEASVKVLENEVFIEQAKAIASQVRMGSSLSAAARSADVFGDLAVNMLAVGEEGAKLEQNLNKIALIYEQQAQEMTEHALNVLGPGVLIAVVMVVGFLMFAVILPLVRLNMVIQ